MADALRAIKPRALYLDRFNNLQALTSQGKSVWAPGYKRIVTRIPSASLLTLFTTPFQLIAAPAAGLAHVVHRVRLNKPAGTAYAGIAAGEDFVLKYTNAAGQQITSVVETTGFLDQATAQFRAAFAPATTGATAGDVTPVNGAVVATLLVGDITTGTSDLYCEVLYDTLQLAFVD